MKDDGTSMWLTWCLLLCWIWIPLVLMAPQAPMGDQERNALLTFIDGNFRIWVKIFCPVTVLIMTVRAVATLKRPRINEAKWKRRLVYASPVIALILGTILDILVSHALPLP